jgi:hypothetical protein
MLTCFGMIWNYGNFQDETQNLCTFKNSYLLKFDNK